MVEARIVTASTHGRLRATQSGELATARIAASSQGLDLALATRDSGADIADPIW
jgi:hypothetical protein